MMSVSNTLGRQVFHNLFAACPPACLLFERNAPLLDQLVHLSGPRPARHQAARGKTINLRDANKVGAFVDGARKVDGVRKVVAGRSNKTAAALRGAHPGRPRALASSSLLRPRLTLIYNALISLERLTRPRLPRLAQAWAAAGPQGCTRPGLCYSWCGTRRRSARARRARAS